MTNWAYVVDHVNVVWQLLVNSLPDQPQETPTPYHVTETSTPAVNVVPMATP